MLRLRSWITLAAVYGVVALPVSFALGQQQDTSSPVGVWYLLANGYRLEMTIESNGNSFTGHIADEGGQDQELSDFAWDPNTRWLEFRRNSPNFTQWYRISLTYGVVAGRFSHSDTTITRPAYTSFAFHVTGWSPSWLDEDIVPRVWNIAINSTNQTECNLTAQLTPPTECAVLRIDRNQQGKMTGRLKVYKRDCTYSSPPNLSSPICVEEDENDLTSINWDGTQLSFIRSVLGSSPQSFCGTISGRTVQSIDCHDGTTQVSWRGVRAEVLGFGLGSRLSQRTRWQQATRARLINITEGMRLLNNDTAKVAVKKDTGDLPLPPERDDDPKVERTAYKYKTEALTFTVSPGPRFDPNREPPPRMYHGYLATPTSPPPPKGYRPVVVVNGHDLGSARKMLTPGDPDYWYGDSLAQHGFLVLAIDIGHRPGEASPPDIIHPPIVDPGYDQGSDQGDDPNCRTIPYCKTNWEEDGERAFSVRRAIDWLLEQPNVRKDALIITGLSLGGEMTTITGGMDPRIKMVIPAGFSPDMFVMDWRGNHPCYQWHHADIHEYVDVSDYESLIAPRVLVVETGKKDRAYSIRATPWAADKQVLRRTRAAYGPESDKVIHYFHYDAHHWHVGGMNLSQPTRPRGLEVFKITEPVSPGDSSWQTDDSTIKRSDTLYTLINELLP